MGLFGWGKKQPEKKEYDRENLKPVLRCSICTGEQTAGFKEIRTGRFHEVQIIRNEAELNQFMQTYGLDHIEKEY